MVVDIIVDSAVSQWSNILRFAHTDGDCCDIGQRVPAILYQREQRILQIASAVNDNGDYYVTATIDFNKCYHIEINQERNIGNGKVSEFNLNQFLIVNYKYHLALLLRQYQWSWDSK